MNNKEKKEINEGDFVRVWKPVDVTECPYWPEDDDEYEGMDQFDGKVVKVTEIGSDGIVEIKGSDWVFSLDWLTHTNNPLLDIKWIK